MEISIKYLLFLYTDSSFLFLNFLENSLFGAIKIIFMHNVNLFFKNRFYLVLFRPRPRLPGEGKTYSFSFLDFPSVNKCSTLQNALYCTE